MANLTLLHLSDIHLGAPGQEAAQERIAERGIPKALAQHITQGHRKPDLCIFSGDLAHSGKLDQFQKGEAWLRKIADYLESYLFIVPGNHDVSRPNGKVRGAAGFKTIAHDARQTAEAFNRLREEIDKGPFLKVFRNWHKELRNKTGDQVLSDWRGSALGSVSSSRINNVPVTLVGLNSAALSFEDRELRKLVCDIHPLETVLSRANPDEELIVVITHHPAGKTVPEEQYLFAWNDQALQKLLLQSTGPHLYLHGHLHEQNGVSLSLSSGQSLGMYGAGAAYQHPTYPIRFAIYDIDFVSGEIRPWVFKWNDTAGDWETDPTLSYRTRAVLPNPPASPAGSSPVARYVALDEVIKALEKHFGQLSSPAPVGLNDSIERSIPEAEIERLVAEGKLNEAEQLAHENYTRQPGNVAFVEAYVNVLMTLPNKEKAELAWNTLRTSKAEKVQIYSNLSLRFSGFKEHAMAIEVGKHALTLAQASNDADTINKIKGNLGYCLAETDKLEHEVLARKYAQESHQANPSHLGRLDTLGYVKISFGDINEIVEGDQMCLRAHIGAEEGNAAYYDKHHQKALRRIDELKGGMPRLPHAAGSGSW